jgi:hypothetical protein
MLKLKILGSILVLYFFLHLLGRADLACDCANATRCSGSTGFQALGNAEDSTARRVVINPYEEAVAQMEREDLELRTKYDVANPYEEADGPCSSGFGGLLCKDDSSLLSQAVEIGEGAQIQKCVNSIAIAPVGTVRCAFCSCNFFGGENHLFSNIMLLFQKWLSELVRENESSLTSFIHLLMVAHLLWSFRAARKY